jgi:hypothetical protein
MTPGKVVAFLLLGVFNVYIGSWLLGYAASWFLLVIDETTAGRNIIKLPWPSEPYRERVYKVGFLLFLSLVWLLPLFAFFHYTELPGSSQLQELLMVLTTGIVLWLMLPISLLSSLTSESYCEVFRWTVFRRLLQRRSAWLEFYGYTFPLLFGCTLVTYLALFGWEDLQDAAEASSLPWLSEAVRFWSWFFVLPLTAVVAATTLLIYARLIGRLAWMMDFTDEEEEERSAIGPVTPSAHLRAEHDVLEPVEEPVAVTNDVIPFAAEHEPELAIPLPQKVAPSPPAALAPASELLRPPRRLWVRGIYRFPWYPATIKVWLFLTVGSLILACLVRWQLQFRS